jgi:hypothetical protein
MREEVGASERAGGWRGGRGSVCGTDHRSFFISNK